MSPSPSLPALSNPERDDGEVSVACNSTCIIIPYCCLLYHCTSHYPINTASIILS
jgi:hypothetical protein